MKTNYDKYRANTLKEPEAKAKYYLAKEKLNIELLIDQIEEVLDDDNAKLKIKRRVTKLKKYIASMAL